jgi:hypothetical protein
VSRDRDADLEASRDEHRGLGGGGHVRPGRAGLRGCAGQLQGYGSSRHYAALRVPAPEMQRAARANGGDHLRRTYLAALALRRAYLPEAFLRGRAPRTDRGTSDNTLLTEYSLRPACDVCRHRTQAQMVGLWDCGPGHVHVGARRASGDRDPRLAS